MQHAPSHQAVSTQEILEELDQAIVEHMLWIKSWHRALVCSDPPFAEDLAYDPHHLGRFGAWYVKNQHKGLVNQPVIRNLAKLHREMHDRAQDLTLRSRQTGPLPRGEYDAFMDAANAFVAQARRLEKAFSQASSDLDPLTGLHNRQVMAAELERERERFVRSGRICCIALGDLDHFKKVNDSHGHAAGDRVLVASAECFLGQLRVYDLVYRYGGEEFLFCLPDADLTTATNILDRLRLALENHPMRLGMGRMITVTGSFGVAAMTTEESVETIIERADAALYRAKNNGRNQVARWDDTDGAAGAAKDGDG